MAIKVISLKKRVAVAALTPVFLVLLLLFIAMPLGNGMHLINRGIALPFGTSISEYDAQHCFDVSGGQSVTRHPELENICACPDIGYPVLGFPFLWQEAGGCSAPPTNNPAMAIDTLVGLFIAIALSFATVNLAQRLRKARA